MPTFHLLPDATTAPNSTFLLHLYSPLLPSKTLTPKNPNPPLPSSNETARSKSHEPRRNNEVDVKLTHVEESPVAAQKNVGEGEGEGVACSRGVADDGGYSRLWEHEEIGE